MSDQPETSTPSTPSIAQRLKSREPWLLIGEGNCTEADPLTILDTDNHVALEHFIAQLLMEEEGLEFRFFEQSFIPYDERFIDKLTFDVKPEGASEWQEQRHFHFDITDGFNALHARLNRDASA
ncbi:hypothetical protein OS187_08100 [Xanthomonadaceae bacterium JHOS43]|nr:hypothetical protein [Xanthomonadaceae bacterium JHOS43]